MEGECSFFSVKLNSGKPSDSIIGTGEYLESGVILQGNSYVVLYLMGDLRGLELLTIPNRAHLSIKKLK